MKMYHFWNGDYSATFTVMAKNKEDAINNVKEFIEGSENKDWLSIDFQDALKYIIKSYLRERFCRERLLNVKIKEKSKE